MSEPKSNKRAVRRVVDRGMSMIGRLRLRTLVFTIGIVAATWATLLLTSIAWIPIVGVAALAAVATVNKTTKTLRNPVCYECGDDLAGQSRTTYGIVCPRCGSLNLTSHDGEHPPFTAESESDSPVEPPAR